MAEILYDIALPAVLTGFVRELPVPAAVSLNNYLPDKMIPDIEAFIDQVTRTNRAAKFRAFDAETPIGKRDAFSRDRVGLAPLGQKTVITEYERLQINRLNGGNVDPLIRTIYDDVEVNARATRFRMELARGSLLGTGNVTITENGLSGLEYDPGVPSGNIVSAGTVWSNHAAADVLADLLAWVDIYVDQGGDPGTLLVSRTGMRHMLANLGLRQLAINQGVVPEGLTLAQLNSVLEVHGLPMIQVYNARFDVDGTTTRAIPDNVAVMLPSDPTDLGYTAWGITAEALELVEARQIAMDAAPGLVAVVLKDGDPVRRWTKVAATGMPILTDPRRLLIATIF